MSSINLKMGVDNAQFKTGLEQAKGKAQDFKKTVAKVMGGVLAAAGAGMAIRKVMQGIDAIRDKYDRLAKLTKQHGNINTAFFQRAAFVAEQNGTNVEAVAKSMNKLLISTRYATEGSKMYVQAFKDLNIEIDDFQKLDQEGKFKAISDAVRDAADSTKAHEAVLVTMGMRAGELIPMLQGGAEGFEDLAASVKILSEQDLQSIEEFNDAIHKLKEELMGMAAQTLPPVFNEIIDFASAFHEVFSGDFNIFQPAMVKDKKTGFWKKNPKSIAVRVEESMAKSQGARENRRAAEKQQEMARSSLDRSGITGDARANILSSIKGHTTNNQAAITTIFQDIVDAKRRQGALNFQQELRADSHNRYGSSTLLNSMLGELQKINNSGIDLKGQGMNKVEVSREPTVNAFGG